MPRRAYTALPSGLRVLLITASISCVTSLASGATFVVNSTLDAVDILPGDSVCATSGAVCTLRAAVQEANALDGTHAITLPSGIYALTIGGREETAAATGDLNIGFEKTITITGAGAATTIVDANGIDRVFRSAYGNLTLSDLTVRNGRAEGATATSGFGGCLYTFFGSLTLARVVVTGCSTASTSGGSTIGGGILATSTTLTLVDSQITSNTSSGQSPGGGLYISSTTAFITRSTIAGNSAPFGGGVYVFGSGAVSGQSAVTITDSTITQNVATSTTGGGGVFVSGVGSGNSTVAIANSTIAGNTATVGPAGALNAVTESGVTLTNVTIAANSSATGGAVRAQTLLQVKNTIIANNTGAAPTNCAPGFVITSLGNNLEFPGTSCGFSLASDRRVDPLLGTLAANGGPTQTLALMPGSPAIDAGDDATCIAAPVSGRDQRGVSRSVGAGVHCDIGAYERAGTSPAPFTDDPLISGSTAIKAVHVTELRARIHAVRIAKGLAAYAWIDPTLMPGSTPIKAQHVVDLRTALSQAYAAAGMTPPPYTDSVLTGGVTPPKVAHIAELRAAVIAIE